MDRNWQSGWNEYCHSSKLIHGRLDANLQNWNMHDWMQNAIFFWNAALCHQRSQLWSVQEVSFMKLGETAHRSFMDVQSIWKLSSKPPSTSSWQVPSECWRLDLIWTRKAPWWRGQCPSLLEWRPSCPTSTYLQVWSFRSSWFCWLPRQREINNALLCWSSGLLLQLQHMSPSHFRQSSERLPCRVKSELNCFEHYNLHHTTENVACQKTNAQFQEGENAVTQNNVNGGDRPNLRQQVRCEPSPCHPHSLCSRETIGLTW